MMVPARGWLARMSPLEIGPAEVRDEEKTEELAEM